MKKKMMSILLVLVLLLSGCSQAQTPATSATETTIATETNSVPTEPVITTYEPTSLLDKHPLAGQTILVDSLKLRMKNDKLLVGATLGEKFDEKEVISDFVPKHFNQVVCENELKPVTLLVAGPDGGYEGYTYNHAPADKILDFAKANNMVVHGHVLLWFQTALETKWFFQDAKGNLVGREEMLTRLEKYMTDVLSYYWEKYPETINAWDVVNEAVKSENLPADGTQTWEGILRPKTAPEGIQTDMYYATIGEDYVLEAFRLATKIIKALPANSKLGKAEDNIQFFYNDYGSEYSMIKRYATRWLLEQLRADPTIKLDGFGVQNHVAYENVDAGSMRSLFKLYQDWDNFEIRLSETDMSVEQLIGVHPVNTILSIQAKAYYDIFEVVAEFPDLITSIAFWGTTDDLSWLTYDWRNHDMETRFEDYPLLFDKDGKEKPAFWALTDPTKFKAPAKVFNSYPKHGENGDASDDVWGYQPYKQLTGDVDAAFSILWNDKASTIWYVSVKVKDTTKDPEDRILLYLDADNHVSETIDDKHKNATILRTDASVTETSDGYEVYYQLDAGKKINSTTVMGFDIVVIDNDAQKASAWNDLSFSQAKTERDYGKLASKKVSKLTDAVNGTPVIDGSIDDIWAKANVLSTEEFNMLESPAAYGQVRTMWDDSYLYILAEIADPVLTSSDLDQVSLEHNCDSVEVFLDQDNLKSTSYMPDDGQYRISVNNSQTFRGESCKPEYIESATMISKTAFDGQPGYIVEAKIKLPQVMIAPNVIIGFDFQINDDLTGTGVRGGQLTWSDKTNTGYLSPSVLGLLRFKQ